RINGWTAANDQWLPYAAVGTGNFVRAKWYIFRTSQLNQNDLNQIPNMRLRVSQRFAVNAMLEVFNHLSGDDFTVNAMAAELRPSNYALAPLIYRVDLDPADGPAMNNPGEGISRGFEAYSLSSEPQENGSIEATESIIGLYTAACTTDTVAPIRVYQTTTT